MCYRYLTNLFLSAVIGSLVMTCSGKKESSAEASVTDEVESDEWKEMDSFHMVMAESFHPFMDSGNVAPAKTNAAAMEDLAAKWANATLPDKVNNEKVKHKLKALQSSTANFKALVREADDKVIGDSLTNLHDLFHSIMESWYSSEHHDHESH